MKEIKFIAPIKQGKSKSNKITIKHYLNKKLSPYGIIGNDYQYAVYFRVIYNRLSTSYKSQIQRIGYATENEMINNIEVVNDLNYEIELINFIIEYSISNLQNLFSVKGISELVFITNKPLKYLFFEDLCLTENQKDKLKIYISKKTNFTIDLIEDFLVNSMVEIHSKENIIQLFREGIIDIEKKNIIEFYSILVDFEELIYKEKEYFGCKWGASNNLNFYEWKMKNKKNEFIEYVNKNNLIDENNLKNGINHLEKLFFREIKKQLEHPILKVEI